jgi:peptide/nickel transport system substrate-binding protein
LKLKRKQDSLSTGILFTILVLSILTNIYPFILETQASKENGELKNPDKFIWETQGLPYHIDSLDPAINYESSGCTIIEMIYETLVGYIGNSVEEVEGKLASEWTISPDGLKYTFILRNDVYFHDGTILNAYIMKYSLDRAILMNDPWGPSWMIAQVIKGGPTYMQYSDPNCTEAQTFLDEGGVVALDNYTLEINLVSPYSPFLNSLAFDVTSAVSPKAVIENRPVSYTKNPTDDNYGMIPLNLWFPTLTDYTKLGLKLGHNPNNSGVVPGSHRSSVSHHTWMKRNAIGTGPYRLKQITESTVLLTKNQDWWGTFSSHSVEEIEIKSEFDDQIRFQNLINGTSDMAYIEKTDAPKFISPAGESLYEDITVVKAPTLTTYFLGMNMKENIPYSYLNESETSTYNANSLSRYAIGDEMASQNNPFTSLTFRRAMASAFDYSYYLTDILNEIGEQMEGIIPEGILGHHDNLREQGLLPSYDLITAKALFEQVGWRGTIKLVYPVTNEVLALLYSSFANSIVLCNVGIRVILQPLDQIQYEEATWYHEIPVTYCGWAADYADPDNFIAPYLHGVYGVYATSLSYNNPSLNSLIEAAAIEQDVDTRRQMYQNIEEFAANDCPYIPLSQNFRLYIFRDWIQNYEESGSLNPMSSGPNFQHIDKIYAFYDRDSDGMPDLWEFDMGLNVYDPSDAKIDLDGDWVNNVEEYRGGSNPRNFWSFPIISFSIFHVIFILILINISIAVFIVKFRKETEKRNLITRLKAPDYTTALKTQQLGFNDYIALVAKETAAKNLLDKANLLYLQCEFLKSIQQYESALEVFELLENERMIAETTFRMILLQKETQILTSDSHILKRFPKPPYTDQVISAFHHMIQALVAESEKNWGSAEKEWNNALKFSELESEFRAICQNALVESEYKTWIGDPSPETKKKLLTMLNNLQDDCETNNYYPYLCQIFLLRAKIGLASFQFEDVEYWINKSLRIAQQEDIKLYFDLATKENVKFEQLRNNITSILKLETELTPEEQQYRVEEYIREALGIKKGQKNNQ